MFGKKKQPESEVKPAEKFVKITVFTLELDFGPSSYHYSFESRSGKEIDDLVNGLETAYRQGKPFTIKCSQGSVCEYSLTILADQPIISITIPDVKKIISLIREEKRYDKTEKEVEEEANRKQS